MSNVAAPYICAVLREPYHLALLRRSVVFYNFCVKHWHRRLVLDEVLTLVCPSQRRRRPADKVRLVYQCSMESHFADTTAATDGHARVLALRSVAVRATPSMPPQWQLCVTYLKAMFEKTCYYCVPTALFTLCASVGAVAADVGTQPSPATDSLRVAEEAPVLFGTLSVGMSWFRVLNAYPEKRFALSVPQDDHRKACIVVSPCQLIASRTEQGYVMLFDEPGTEVALDLRGVVQAMPQVLPHIFAWRLASVRGTARPAVVKPAAVCNSIDLSQTIHSLARQCSADGQ